MAQHGRRGMVYTESQNHLDWKSPPRSSILTFASGLTKVKLVPLVDTIFSRISGQIKGDQWILQITLNNYCLIILLQAAYCISIHQERKDVTRLEDPNSHGTFTAVEKLMRTDSFCKTKP